MEKGKKHIKKKPNKDPINLTYHGPVRDIAPGGYFPCESSLGRVLTELGEQGWLQVKRQRVSVEVTDVRDNEPGGSDPYRVSLNKEYTVSFLLRLWNESHNSDFDCEKFEESVRFETEALQKQGQQRSAWGIYGASVRLSQEIKEERNFNESLKNLSYEEKERRQEQREKQQRHRTSNLIIA